MLKKSIAFGLLVVFLGPALWTIVFRMGWDRHYHKHHPGKCSVLKTPGYGSEDFQILSSGMTFISSGLYMEMASPDCQQFMKSKGKGSIQMIDMNNPASGAEDIPIKHGSDFNRNTFRPHGLSVLEDKIKGEHFIYVINHVEGGPDRVEKFRYSPKSKELRHEKSIFSETFKAVNDLSAVEEDKFYISNWLYFVNNKVTFIEHLYHLPLGGVVFYNGTGGTVVKGGMFSPNGIILSNDNSYLYLSLPFIQKIEVYKRKSDYDLELAQEVSIHTGLDNFHVSGDGEALYGGCCPINYKALAYLSSPEGSKAPSQVLRIPLKNGLIVEDGITEEFYDHGDLVSGSSIASVYRGRMLIGSVLDTLVACDLPKE